MSTPPGCEIKDPASLSSHAGKVAGGSDYVERMGESAIGRRLDGMGTKVVKEGAKAVNESVNPDKDN